MVSLSLNKLNPQENPRKSILSVDVGLTNLAFCWLENYNSEQWKIHYWKVIDMNTQHSPDTHCSHVCTNKKPCKRNAVMLSSDGSATCKQHGPKATGTKGTASKGTSPKGTASKGTTSISTSRDVLQRTIHNAITYIKKFLEDNKEALKGVTGCVIEKQPMKSTALQTMSHVIYTLFIEHFGTSVPVYMTPAYNKAVQITGLVTPPKASKGRAGYKQRKQNGVIATQAIIEYWKEEILVLPDAEHGIAKLRSNKGKLDDYSDSFLQALFEITTTSTTATTK